MSADARARAERCFALARSTTFEGERANAIAMGERIAQAAGLDLDGFDIPGRAKATAPPRPRMRVEVPDDFGERWRKQMREAMESAVFRDVYATNVAKEAARMAANRRRFEESVKNASDAAARMASEVYRVQARTAANRLWAKGWRVYQEGEVNGAARWLVIDRENVTRYSGIGDKRLIEVAVEEGA